MPESISRERVEARRGQAAALISQTDARLYWNSLFVSPALPEGGKNPEPLLGGREGQRGRDNGGGAEERGREGGKYISGSAVNSCLFLSFSCSFSFTFSFSFPFFSFFFHLFLCFFSLVFYPSSCFHNSWGALCRGYTSPISTCPCEPRYIVCCWVK